MNGQVKYSIVQQPNQKGTKFNVDEETGEVFTNKVFDREGDDGKFVSVTVKATDSGEPSLEGVCSFTVEITDVNDNPPLFDRQVRQCCPNTVRITERVQFPGLVERLSPLSMKNSGNAPFSSSCRSGVQPQNAFSMPERFIAVMIILLVEPRMPR